MRQGNKKRDFALLEAGQMTTDVLPSLTKHSAAVAPKRDRRLTLTKLDRRGRFGRRVAELTAMFTDAVGGELTPMRRLKVERAAQMVAVSEQARGKFMRDGSGNLENILLAERRAAAACRAVGISVF
jgi:hypothetical protein